MNRRTRLVLAALGAIVLVGLLWQRIMTHSEINVLNWDFYIGSTTLQTFSEGTHVKVNYKIFADNEEARDFLVQSPATYDIVVPSDYMMTILADEQRLAEIDLSAIPNLANVDPVLVDEFKARGWLKHCVPYTWGVTGFAVRTKGADREIVGATARQMSWAFLRENARASQSLRGKVAVIDDPLQIIGSALMEIGADPGAFSKEELNKAVELLQGVRPLIREFTKDTGKDLMRNGEVLVVFGSSGDAFQVAQKLPEWEFSSPAHGGFKFQDGICMPAAAPHREAALAFMNHILDAKVHQNIIETDFYYTKNLAAVRRLDGHLADDLEQSTREGGPLRQQPPLSPQVREELEKAWLLVKR